jgi:hypothetical protein
VRKRCLGISILIADAGKDVGRGIGKKHIAGYSRIKEVKG